MPILENKLVDELVKATLAVFESVFASKICDYQNKKITLNLNINDNQEDYRL